MTTYTLDSTKRGQIITSSPGAITAIRWMKGMSPSYAWSNGYTALCDSSTNPPRLLWGCDFGLPGIRQDSAAFASQSVEQ
jgi:hypothetical protein